MSQAVERTSIESDSKPPVALFDVNGQRRSLTQLEMDRHDWCTMDKTRLYETDGEWWFVPQVVAR